MATPPPAALTLQAWLREAKARAIDHLAAPRPPDEGNADGLVLVMGNEAGDLDSVACAIGLAYALDHGHPPLAERHAALPANLRRLRYVPLLQSVVEDARLRPENLVALGLAKVEPTDLLHLSELTLPPAQGGLGLDLASSEALSPTRLTFLALVDHAALGARWGDAKDAHRSVLAVVDHHVDEGAHEDAALRVFEGPGSTDAASGSPVQPAGSCASLVTRDVFDETSQASFDPPKELIDLLLSAILIDTDNLRPGGKASPTDATAAHRLLPRSSFSDAGDADRAFSLALSSAPDGLECAEASPPRAASTVESGDVASSARAYWRLLSSAKLAVRHLDDRDLLRRDYKESVWDANASRDDGGTARVAKPLRIGFSSVPMGLATWLHRGRGASGAVEGRADDDDDEERGRISARASEEDWSRWWTTLAEWMAERQLDGAVVGTSYRKRGVEDGTGRRGEHYRELVFAFGPAEDKLDSAQTLRVWTSMFDALSRDAHAVRPAAGGGNTGVAAAAVEDRLMLETPWKGRRLLETGKRERVAGTSLSSPSGHEAHAVDVGRGTVQPLPGSARKVPLHVAVWRQANARASRKVVLPAVIQALQQAVRAL